MIKRLFLDGCFRHQNRTFVFDKGLTGIVGPNESGKSLIVEMVRYSLFGSKALRGLGENYKKLHVELDFVVREVVYTVLRKASRCELSVNGQITASGVKPVDQAIRSLLGYDLGVFDVANACNQGNIEALSDMLPSARKAMVDRTIGLTALDEVLAMCGTEGNTLKREAAAMSATLVTPVAPEELQHRPLAEIAADSLRTTAEVAELNQLVGFLSKAPSEPVAPPEADPGPSGEVLQQAQKDHDEYQHLQGFIASAASPPVNPGPYPSDLSLAEMTSRMKIRAEVRELQAKHDRIEPETLSEAEITAALTHHDKWDQFQQKQKLLAQGHICCPACDHSWPVAADELSALADVQEVAQPPRTRRELTLASTRNGNDALRLGLEQEIAALPSYPDYTADRAQVVAYEAQAAAWDAYQVVAQGLPLKLARRDALRGSSEALDALRKAAAVAQRYQDAHARYEKDLEAYQEYLRVAEAKAARFNVLKDAPEKLSAYHQEHKDAEDYLRCLKEYALLLQRHAELSAEVLEISKLSEEYLKAKEIITALKVSVKSHLLPSLNKVASILLTQMSGGERSHVQVDDAFEILVDGQALATLSGSGKAIANLAIRIALGQILTNRSFSLFMADEVDAAMDDERASFTAEALRRLTSNISQVILVTHKSPLTDHRIELTK